MSSFTPYTYFQCPCTDTSTPSRGLGEAVPTTDEEADEDERTFDPRAPRANYSLYPLEHLIYCEDCHQIRCPRCVLDEIVVCYCPGCNFEVATTSLKSDNNRCSRSCLHCPICTSSLLTSSTKPPPEGLGAETAALEPPFILQCPYCMWTSKEIGIEFEKATGIRAQLAKIKNGGESYIAPRERRREQMKDKDLPEITEDGLGPDVSSSLDLDPEEQLDVENHFSNLKYFYQAQLKEANPNGGMGFTGDYGYGSPAALTRLMGMYTGGKLGGTPKTSTKPVSMREACDATEGLQISKPTAAQQIARLRSGGWDATASRSQRREQLTPVHFTSDLRPVPTLIRTRRSKRCRTCRHILSKPESKLTTTRFRIRLIALNYIPSITIKPLTPSPTPHILRPLTTTQFLLTFKNPLFEAVKVSIAAPGKTMGRFASGITILCPQFEVGANTDVWDEALGDAGGERKRTKTEAIEGQNIAEAGKVWERGRNWVSIVVEVIPASLGGDRYPGAGGRGFEEEGEIGEDEDVVEIPAFVRVEWEEAGEEGGGKDKEKEARETRELAYWCVLGVGRIEKA